MSREDALRAQAAAWRALADAVEAEADALDAAAPATVPASAIYMKVTDYAARVSVSERTGWALIKKGLPTVGSGRGRRVDVQAADAWLRDHKDRVEDALEIQARTAARRAAGAR